jgi:hypothetical protein
MTLLPLFHWLGRSWLGVSMSQSTYGFAIVEMIHLLALAVLGGVVLLVDLRLLGIGLRTQPVSKIARELSPLFWGSLAFMIVSGFLLVASATTKYYYNEAFRLKMLLFAAGLLFYFAVHRRITRIDRQPGPGTKAMAVFSLLLWLSIGLAGRAIGFI